MALLKFILITVTLSWVTIRAAKWVALKWHTWKAFRKFRTASDATKARVCWVALIASMLFLVIGVDYMPHSICWLPLIVTFYFSFNCEAFLNSLKNFSNFEE